MNTAKRPMQRLVLTLFTVWTMLLATLPAPAQDLVSTSEDLSGGSSVFVFRQSRKAAQTRYVSKSKAPVKRNTVLRVESRKKVREQIAVVAKAKPRQKANKVDPSSATVASATKTPTGGGRTGGGRTGGASTTVNTASKEQASTALAGAAEVYLERNELDKALEYFKKSVELNPKNEPAKLGYSEALVLKGDKSFEEVSVESSTYFYEQAIKFNANNAAAHAGLGEALDSMGKSDLAIVSYEKALALDPALTELFAPAGILYYQKGEIAKAEGYLAKALAARPTDGETQYFYGLILYKQNRNDEALRALQSSIKTAPTPEAYLTLGEVYDRLEREREAIQSYQEAIRLNPKYAEAHYNLGVAFYNRERYLEAKTAYEEAVRLKNDYADAHANLADTLRQLATIEKDAAKKKDYFGKAVGAYTLATAFIKDDPELFSKYGYVLGKLGRWNNAVDALKKAVAIESDAIDYTNLGWAYYNAALDDTRMRLEAPARQKLTEARSALEKAVSLNNKLDAAYLNLGITQSDLGDYAAAIKTLQAALKLRKNWVGALNELGIAYRKTDRLEDAVEQFRKATEIDDKFAPGFYNLAESEYRRGRTKEANKAMDKLRKLNPNLAKQLEVILKGTVVGNVQNKVENKIQEKNPLNKIPRIP
jgi:tetratricopeptide (TPR) repeat protein